MKQENIEFLEKNRKCYVEVVGHPAHGRSATLANVIAGELLSILREEFLAGYPPPSDCGNCLFDMVTVLYQKFDEYMATQPKKEVVVATSFPKNDPAPSFVDPEYQEYLNWKRQKKLHEDIIHHGAVRTPVIHIHGETVKSETPEERKARLSDPNREIKRRAKRK